MKTFTCCAILILLTGQLVAVPLDYLQDTTPATTSPAKTTAPPKPSPDTCKDMPGGFIEDVCAFGIGLENCANGLAKFIDAISWDTESHITAIIKPDGWKNFESNFVCSLGFNASMSELDYFTTGTVNNMMSSYANATIRQEYIDEIKLNTIFQGGYDVDATSNIFHAGDAENPVHNFHFQIMPTANGDKFHASVCHTYGSYGLAETQIVTHEHKSSWFGLVKSDKDIITTEPTDLPYNASLAISQMFMWQGMSTIAMDFNKFPLNITVPKLMQQSSNEKPTCIATRSHGCSKDSDCCKYLFGDYQCVENQCVYTKCKPTGSPCSMTDGCCNGKCNFFAKYDPKQEKYLSICN